MNVIQGLGLVLARGFAFSLMETIERKKKRDCEKACKKGLFTWGGSNLVGFSLVERNLLENENLELFFQLQPWSSFRASYIT